MSEFSELDIALQDARGFIKEGYTYWESVDAVCAEFDLTARETNVIIHALAKEGIKPNG